MSEADMSMLCWMYSSTRKGELRNDDIFDKVGVASIEEKVRENSYNGFVMCGVDILKH